MNDYKNIIFTNLAIDRVSVEIQDIIKTIFEFLDGKIFYLGRVNNKYNMKNHCYQYMHSSNITSIRNTIIDANLLLQVNISKDLTLPKDFSLDKKVK